VGVAAFAVAVLVGVALREAGVADQVICEYLRVEEAALPGLYRLAEAKLVAAQRTSGAAASRR